MSKDDNNAGLYILMGITVLVIIAGTTTLILVLTILKPTASVGSVPCSSRTSGLLSVTGTPCYVNSQGRCSLNRYSDQILGGTFLYTTPTNYTVVCQPLCVGYLDTNWNCCSDGNPDCQAMKASYDNCVSTIEPNQCNGEALPVAIDGNILYYAGQVISNAGAVTCDCSTIGI